MGLLIMNGFTIEIMYVYYIVIEIYVLSSLFTFLLFMYN
jgi:hypothetical protein